MSIMDVLLLILIIVGIVTGIYIIITLRNYNQALVVFKKDFEKLNNRLEPILENFNALTEKIINISDETEKRIYDLSDTIQNVRNTVSKFSFIRGSKSDSRNPVQDLLSNATAISKGVSAFWKKLNN
ncbi:MAG: hypothetical protein H6613_19965 [Ignavibacteriales bacterium]|nr:hypothetical protein [Ignavibacteriales bacterium]